MSMGPQVQVLRCPECDAFLREIVRHSGFQAGGTSIGPAVIACPDCNECIDTGQSEWCEKNWFRKFTFLLHRFLWFVVASILVAGAFAVVVSSIAEHLRWIPPKQNDQCAIVAFAFGTLCMATAFLLRIQKEIRESHERVASELSRSARE